MDQNYTLDATPSVEASTTVEEPRAAARTEPEGAEGSATIPIQRAEVDSRPSVAKPGRGRPSLGGKGRSPQVTFRAPPSLRAQAEERAARDGKTVSQLAREAFEMYLTS